jgi:hypothetical protein
MTSGPGAMSRRTDGGPASKQAQRYISGMPNYGDGQQLMDLQASAPMAKTATPSAQPLPMGEMGQAQQPSVIPIDAPSQRPNEPVTSGAAMGAGPGPEALNTPSTMQQQGFVNALALLNQLGNNVTPEVKSIRNALAAHLNNQAGA